MDPQLPGAPAAEQVAAFSQEHRTGLVTLLFADLVGSTELKQRAGDAPGLRLIDQHHAAVRELWTPSRHGSNGRTRNPRRTWR